MAVDQRSSSCIVKSVGGEPYPLPTDVRDERAVTRSVEEIVQRLGRVDFLAHFAHFILENN